MAVTNRSIALQFKAGATVHDLAWAYGFTDLKIEEIIRKAMKERKR